MKNKYDNCNIAVIILNYKTWEDTLDEIDTCRDVLNVKMSNIIVVDNYSPNNSATELEKRSQELGFIFIKSDKNAGYAYGNNIGLRYAYSQGYEFALILNNDIIIQNENMLNRLLDIFSFDRRIAIVNPDVYSPGGYLFNRDAIRPSFFDFTLGMIRYRRIGRKITDLGGYGYVYRPQGCCMMVDLNKIQEVGYMDEGTFLYCEEMILAERLLYKGYLCACDINSSIIHNHSKTVKSTMDIKKIIEINNKSFEYYLRKYRRYGKVKTRICCLFNALKLKIINI